MSALSGRPLGLDQFFALMDALGPFEPNPHLAVAVSGGPDSLALALLARDWIDARGGRLDALVVDHGLRAESAAEAALVAARLAAQGVPATILRWEGAKPTGAVQAAARDARYALLAGWCRAAGVLHLLLGHQRDDLAETLLLRLAAGSGPDGLAAMPAIAETGWGRLLRPLLTVPPGRLRATLQDRGVAWVEDPSNRDPRHARVRLRAGLADGRPAAAARLADVATGLGRCRAIRDDAGAALAAQAIEVSAWGHLWLDPSPVADAPGDVARRVVARALMAAGGRIYPPRGERLAPVLGWLTSDRAVPPARTLAGCRLIRRGARVLIVREPAALGPPVRLAPGGRARWDGRFDLVAGPALDRPLEVGALGDVAAARRTGLTGLEAVPAPARPSLPCLRDLEGGAALPHLLEQEPEQDAPELAVALFAPPLGVAAGRFAAADFAIAPSASRGVR
jgi:tRNA(Ile)-lysidine synthase